MKRIFPHLAAPVCGLAAGWTVYCTLDLLIIVGMGLDQYPRFTPFLALNVLLAGGITLALGYLTLRLWNQYESKRWMVILYTAEAAAVFLPGMWACEKALAWLQRMF